MKLIEQLVEYLRSRGSLTDQQIKRLEGKGFIAPTEEEEPEPHRKLEAERHDGHRTARLLHTPWEAALQRWPEFVAPAER